MRKKIGVFMGEVIAEYQEVVLKAIFAKAKELDYDVFVFANFGAYGNKILYAEGEKGIITLPDFSVMDGLIVSEDTLDIIGMGAELEDRIRKQAACPVVYIRTPKEGVYNVCIENEKAMEEVTRHFVYDHGFRDICFVTGKKDYLDAGERYSGFLKVMEEAGIEVTEHMVYEGDYWRQDGKKIVDWFTCEREDYPRAIICSNDFEAFSVCEELERRGVKVPEEVCVSGFDNLQESRMRVPALTTVAVPFAEFGTKAVEMIDRIIHGREQKLTEYVDPKLIRRGSCGCGSHKIPRDWGWMPEKIFRQDNSMKQIVFMTTDCQDAMGEKEYLLFAEKYAANIPCERAYMCFCDEKQFGSITPEHYYTDQMILRRIIYRDQEVERCEDFFERKNLLPERILDTPQPQAYVIFSIHHRNKCYGYMAFCFKEQNWMNSYTQAYLMSLANAIEDAKMHDEMSNLEQIKSFYLMDTLTGIYNRRGYEKKLSELYDRFKKEEFYLTVVSIDMDGLKYINDHFGHAEGDDALKRLAGVMKKLEKPEEVSARTGGDEFSMLLVSDNRQRHSDFIRTFKREIREEEKRVAKPYPFSASIGLCNLNEANLPLMACIQMADKEMYIQKKASKLSRD